MASSRLIGSTLIDRTNSSGSSGDGGCTTTSFGSGCAATSAAVRARRRAANTITPPTRMKVIFGMPGTSAMTSSAAPPVCIALCCLVNWAMTLVPRSSSPAARVTMSPELIETNNAGICVTRPSPTVRVA